MRALWEKHRQNSVINKRKSMSNIVTYELSFHRLPNFARPSGDGSGEIAHTGMRNLTRAVAARICDKCKTYFTDLSVIVFTSHVTVLT